MASATMFDAARPPRRPRRPSTVAYLPNDHDVRSGIENGRRSASRRHSSGCGMPHATTPATSDGLRAASVHATNAP